MAKTDNNKLFSFVDKHSKKIIMGLLLLSVVSVGAFAVTLYLYKTDDSVENTAETNATDMGGYTSYKYTADEWAEAKNRVSVSGSYQLAGLNKITVKDGTKVVFLTTTATTTYNRGASGQSITAAELIDGEQVSVVYDNETLTALDVWASNESEE